MASWGWSREASGFRFCPLCECACALRGAALARSLLLFLFLFYLIFSSPFFYFPYFGLLIHTIAHRSVKSPFISNLRGNQKKQNHHIFHRNKQLKPNNFFKEHKKVRGLLIMFLSLVNGDTYRTTHTLYRVHISVIIFLYREDSKNNYATYSKFKTPFPHFPSLIGKQSLLNLRNV